MNYVDARGIARQKRRFFHCRIAAANDHQAFAAKRGQRAVAGRTRRNAVAAKAEGRLCLAGNAQPLCRGARRNNQRVGFDDLIIGVKREWTLLKIDLRDPLFQKLSAEALRLFAKLDHQVRALDAFRKAGIVFHVGRNHQLAAGRRLLLGIMGRID